MKNFLLIMLVAGGVGFGADFSVGVRIWDRRRLARNCGPAGSPGPGYAWVEVTGTLSGIVIGGNEGYWTRPPYEGTHWVTPHYDRERYFGGYWEGSRGRFEHNHHWDRDHDRDFGRDHDDANRAGGKLVRMGRVELP